MNKVMMLAGAALVAATASIALAQPAAPARPDRDADISRQQLLEQVDQRFARLDVNNDGRATAEEVRQAHAQRRAERAGRMFARIDADGDGSVSRAEFDQHHAQRREHRAERGHRGWRGGHRRGGHGMRAERPFGEDGVITREQMREHALARFDRLDADRNGTLTAAERRQAREQWRAEHRGRRGQQD